MIRIEKMCLKDLDQVVEIEKEEFSIPWSKKGFLDSIKRQDTLYLAAFCDDLVVGYCGLLCALDEAEITNVAVKKEFRRQGTGSKMLKELLSVSEQNGIRYFVLEVRKSNSSAILLYEKLGFIPAGIRKNFYEKPTEDAVIMCKS